MDKYALIMSSNYSGPFQLYGCVNDGNNMKAFLINQRGFPPANVKTLFDSQMTAKAMWAGMDDLRKKAEASLAKGRTPAIVLYYSGHGLLLPDFNKDEQGGKDGAIVPWDHQKVGFIVDDDLYSRFLAKLPAGTQIFIFPDCCYSGSNFDIEYMGVTQKYPTNKLDVSIVELSGCRDDQTSAEISGRGVATSAFLSLMETVRSPYKVSQLQTDMKDLSIPGNSQNPQVSVSRAGMMDQELFPWLVDKPQEARTQKPANPYQGKMVKAKPDGKLAKMMRDWFKH